MATQNGNALTLTRSQLDALANALGDVNSMLLSIHAFASEMVASPSDRHSNCAKAVAIETLAKVCARKADLVVQALGDSGFGSFEDEFNANLLTSTAAGEASTGGH